MFTASAALVVSVAFAASALAKARRPRLFREQLADYGFLPYALTRMTAYAVLACEAAAAVLLLVPRLRVWAAIGACGLLGAFLTALIVVTLQRREISCGCFGGSGELDRISASSLVRTGALGMCAIAATLSGTKQERPIDVAVAGLLLVAVFILSETVRLYSTIWRAGAEIRTSLPIPPLGVR